MRLQHLNKLWQNAAICTMFRAGGVQPEPLSDIGALAHTKGETPVVE